MTPEQKKLLFYILASMSVHILQQRWRPSNPGQAFLASTSWVLIFFVALTFNQRRQVSYAHQTRKYICSIDTNTHIQIISRRGNSHSERTQIHELYEEIHLQQLMSGRGGCRQAVWPVRASGGACFVCLPPRSTPRFKICKRSTFLGAS